MRHYTVVLDPDPVEGGYSVSVPALPGCFSQGDTVEKALEHIREAIELHLSAMVADGEPVPDDVTPLFAYVAVAEPTERRVSVSA